MDIYCAYCKELGRDVDIYEAQEEYFSKPRSIRKRFHFYCSDELCRATSETLVVGVNYDKNIEETAHYRQPHFKTHPKHPHIDKCIWMREAERIKEKANANDSLVNTSSEDMPKVSNIIDVFNPRQSDMLLDGVTSSACRTAVNSCDSSIATAEKNDAHEKNRKRTCSYKLQSLVDCWLSMRPEQRRSNNIVICGRTVSYYNLFTRIKYLCNTEESNVKIVYGRAYAETLSKDGMYIIYFMDNMDNLVGADDNKSVFLSLSIEHLNKMRNGGLLLEGLEKGSRKGWYLKVYAFGRIERCNTGGEWV